MSEIYVPQVLSGNATYTALS